jgi:hypothetical protein
MSSIFQLDDFWEYCNRRYAKITMLTGEVVEGEIEFKGGVVNLRHAAVAYDSGMHWAGDYCVQQENVKSVEVRW